MADRQVCPECGSEWTEAQMCEAHFHQMLYWENENPRLGEVHHLMVLCYYLQHPSYFSPEGLAEALNLLTAFVRDRLSPDQTRSRNSSRVASNRRDWKITGRPGRVGQYTRLVHWPMTARDVVANGAEHYCDSVRQWAKTVYEAVNE